MNMVILPGDQIDNMVEVMDTILKPGNKTVEDIKKKYHLTSAEYDMIFDLTMPLIRHGNSSEKWKSKYLELRDTIMERIRAEKPKSKLTSDIYGIIENGAGYWEKRTLEKRKGEVNGS